MIGAELFQKVVSLGVALLTGEDVSRERLEKRLEICRGCDKVRIQGNAQNGTLSCGVCGCKLRGDKSLVNLARYEETAHYGCRHPRGSRWKANGV
jgi:hypothetical protein